MQTYPITDKTGLMFALEIENAYASPGAVARIIERVEGVSSVSKRRPFSSSAEIHVSFLYHGRPFAVVEPYGDNSRYWIGPKEDLDAARIDISGIDRALKQYQPSTVRELFGNIISLRFLSMLKRLV